MEDYKIISAEYTGGEKLLIPISWVIDNPATDLIVYLVSDGQVSICDYWTWNSDESRIEIPNSQGFSTFYAYVQRIEQAVMLAQLVSSGKIHLSDLIEQFKKNVRVLEQLQDGSDSNLRSPDYIKGLLPPSGDRAGYVLSFDSNGNPNCSLTVKDVSEAYLAMDKAIEQAEIATDKAEDASESANIAASEKNSVSEMKSSVEDLISIFDKDYSSKKAYIDSQVEIVSEKSETVISKANEANSASESALLSESNALEYANNALTNANDAHSAALEATGAKNTCLTIQSEVEDKAEEAVEAASISTQKAADAQNAANAAAQSAANAQQISDPENRIGALQLLKSGEGQLYFNGGTATNSTFAPLVPFSAVATVVFTGGASKILTIGNAILSVGADGKLTLTDGTHSATSTTTITQGVPVALTMIVKATTALVY